MGGGGLVGPVIPKVLPVREARGEGDRVKRGGVAATTARFGRRQDQVHRGFDVAVKVPSRDAARAEAAPPEPIVSCHIMSRAFAHPVSNTVDLDAEFRGRAIEVEHIGAHRMLSAGLQAAGAGPQDLP
jgi:hypothetical protein